MQASFRKRSTKGRFAAGVGIAMLGWAMCLGMALLVVVLKHEFGIDLEGLPDSALPSLIWLPGLCYLIFRCLKHGERGMVPRIAGYFFGLAVPVALALAIVLVWDIPVHG